MWDRQSALGRWVSKSVGCGCAVVLLPTVLQRRLWTSRNQLNAKVRASPCSAHPCFLMVMQVYRCPCVISAVFFTRKGGTTGCMRTKTLLVSFYVQLLIANKYVVEPHSPPSLPHVAFVVAAAGLTSALHLWGRVCSSAAMAGLPARTQHWRSPHQYSTSSEVPCGMA